MRFFRRNEAVRLASFVLVTVVGATGIFVALRHTPVLRPNTTWLHRGNYVTALQMVTRLGVDGSTTILPNAAPSQPTLVIEATGEQLQSLNFATLLSKHNGRIRVCVLNPYADPALRDWLDDALLVQPATARLGFFADNSLRLHVYPKFFLLAPKTGLCVSATAGIDTDEQLTNFVANALSNLPNDQK